MIVEGPDGREYGYASDIGEQLFALGIGNGAGLVRKWAQLGLLTPAGNVDGRPIYAWDAVMAVELRQRRAAATRPGGRQRLTSTPIAIHTVVL